MNKSSLEVFEKSIPTNHLWDLLAEWLSLLLQIGAIFVGTKWGRIITNGCIYYKPGQIYYKLGQPLQIEAIERKCFVKIVAQDMFLVVGSIEDHIFEFWN